MFLFTLLLAFIVGALCVVAWNTHERVSRGKYDNLAGCEQAASNIHNALFKVEDTLTYCEVERDKAKEELKQIREQYGISENQDTQE